MSVRRIVVVDDHDAFRSAAAALFDGGGFEVVGTAATGEAALTLIERVRPDVVLLDIRLPDATGFDIARRLHGLSSPPAVVLVSSLAPEDVASRLDPETVRGFVSKSRLTAEAVRSLLTER